MKWKQLFVVDTRAAKLAEVVKLVDALASGASRGNSVEVQVLYENNLTGIPVRI